MLRAYGMMVVQVLISLKGQVFYGELMMAGAGQTQVFDGRSSDGIALAIHFGTPIFIEEAFLERTRKGENLGGGFANNAVKLRFHHDIDKGGQTVGPLDIRDLEFKSKETGFDHERREKASFWRIGVKKSNLAASNLSPSVP